MRPVDKMLDRLDKVRKNSGGWSALCPSHQDTTASLSLAEGEDGRALVHCFAGCNTFDVLAAIGLTLADLFPERIRSTMTRQERTEMLLRMRQANWAAALNILGREAMLVEIAARDVAAGRALPPDDVARLAEAVECIADARLVLNG